MKRAIVCFTRVPKPGITKTRLLPVLTGSQCAQLHTAFLQDLAGVYPQVDADLFLFFTADPDWEMLKEVFPSARDFCPQAGTDLGERMYHALRHALELGYEKVILTGADLPCLTAAHLESAFEALSGADIVLGPTSDGGYYLVGMKKPHRTVFENQSYGGSTVLEKTIAAAWAADLTVSLASPCDDVDTPEDLRALTAQLSPDSATYQYLVRLKKEGVSL